MDVTLANFEREVLLASREKPVLVDFWAPWCGPCRSLTPALEKLEREYGGRFKLVKVNVDENQQLAAHFQARSIPLVVAILDGRPVDQFTGALPEGQLRAFIDRLLPLPHEQEHQQALAAMQAGDAAAAEKHLRAALMLEASYDPARMDYVELLLTTGRPEDAKAQFELLTPQAKADPHYANLETALNAVEQAQDTPEETELLTRIQQNPDDLQARLDLANKRIARRAWAGAMDELLEIVRRDRSFQDEIGRKTMIAVFDMASAQPELVAQYRRKLSSLLF
ncbi:MAG: thioredoxin [Pigmentiphaga sp.]|uniref:thioredoxin n=1 Tax=Pigmentiphaga sp. TaxID=1977564 RepID=UPI0029B5964E|nr:thioredoxin [Pigmentiphaga sp.]MDX3904736.1 thioredoxin [Pigmentiphaga sp.]